MDNVYVSQGDVSMGDVTDGNMDYIVQEQVPEPTLWDKSLSDYTVTEGLLFLIFLLLLWSAIVKLIGGVTWHR